MRAWIPLLCLLVLTACATTADDDDSSPVDDDDVIEDDDATDDDDSAIDDDDATDDDDSAIDDDDAMDDDDSAAPVGFLISYSFTNMDLQQGTCAEAGRTELWVEVGVSREGPVQVTQFTCDDQPLQVVPGGAGTYQLTVTTQPGNPDVYYQAQTQATAAAGLTPLTVELECFDPGIDDGCGGA